MTRGHWPLKGCGPETLLPGSLFQVSVIIGRAGDESSRHPGIGGLIMPESEKNGKDAVGISGLPKSWSVVVQLVGTFGLAVFLVLYYVLYMYPKEVEKAEKYDELETSVRDLIVSVESQKALLSNEQANKLEDLFVSAVASEYCARAIDEMKFGRNSADISNILDGVIRTETRKLQGLERKDGLGISEMLVNKISESDISRRVAEAASERWNEEEPLRWIEECRYYLDEALGRLRMAK